MMQKNPLEAFLDLNQSITYIFPVFKKIDIPKLLKKDFYFIFCISESSESSESIQNCIQIGSTHKPYICIQNFLH